MPVNRLDYEGRNTFPFLRMSKNKYEKNLSEKIEYGNNLFNKLKKPIGEIDDLIIQRQFWEKSIVILINRAFEDGNIHLLNFHNKASNELLDEEMSKDLNINNEKKLIAERYKVSRCLRWLKTHKEAIPLFEEDNTVVIFSTESNNITKQLNTTKPMNNNCFIIHGHNKERKLEIARFIENRLGKKTIILHEQASAGKTIIEKFEKHSEVDFAIAIWTADDIGKAQIDQIERPRARQNVVLETGYFAGKLGRDRVIILCEKGVEIPSDLLGLVYIELEGGWEEKLRQEIEAIYL